MASELTFGVKLTADGKSAVTGINETQGAMDKLSQSTRTASTDAEKLNATQQFQSKWFNQTAQSVRDHNTAVAETSGSINKLLDRYDPLSARLRQLQADFKALDAAASSGKITGKDDARVDAVYAKIQAEINAASAAAAGFGSVAGGAMDKAAAATERGMFATVQARRELVVLGHEALTGNFSRMPGSMMVLAERTNLSMASLLGLGGAALGVAAAAGVMLYAMHAGAEEQKEMNRALALTGDFAGLTRGGLISLAETVSQNSKMTIGQSKQVVTELAASGKIGAESFASVANLVALYTQATGESADKVTPKIVKLFSDPAKGAEELNKTMHFLSAAELERIDTLQRTGHEVEAQLLLSARLKEQLEKLKEPVGYLEDSWNSLAKAASNAWDKMKGVGRDKTVDEQLKEETAKLAAMRQITSSQADIDEQEAHIRNLAALKAKTDSDAETARAAARKNTDEQELLALRNKNSELFRRKQIQEEINKLEAAKVAPGSWEEKNNQSAIAGLKKQLETKTDRHAENEAYRAAIAPEEARQKALGDLTKRAEADRKLSLEAGEISQAEYIEAMNNLRDAELRAQIDSYRREEAAALAHKKKADAIKYGGEADAAQKALDALPEHKTDQLAAAANKQRLSALPITQSLAADYRKTDESRARAFELDLMSESERRLAQAMHEVNDRARTAREALDLKFPEKERQAAAYKDELTKIGAKQQAEAQSTQEWAARQDELNASWEHGADQALQKYLDQVSNVSSQSEQMMTQAFKGMEDALVNFVKTGKLDFKSLADSIISDLIRIAVRQSITAPLASALGFSMFSANGNAFGADGVHAFAAGGTFTNSIISGPTPFAFANGGRFGLGVMGEAGDEAVMPLTRINGKLGVQAAGGGGGNNVTVNLIESPGGKNAGQVNQRQGGDGSVVIDVIVDSIRGALSREISRGEGLAVPLERRYGLNAAAGALR